MDAIIYLFIYLLMDGFDDDNRKNPTTGSFIAFLYYFGTAVVVVVVLVETANKQEPSAYSIVRIGSIRRGCILRCRQSQSC
jgi:hypothetical protein